MINALSLIALAKLDDAGSSGNFPPLPIFRADVTAKPTLKIRKRLAALGTKLTLGGDVDLLERTVAGEASWEDAALGGELSLSASADERLLRYRKTWFFPGLTDAATRVEVTSSLDLHTMRGDAELKVGLRRKFARRGVGIVHTLDLAQGVRADVGATLHLPDEVSVVSVGRGADAPPRPPLAVEVDLDRLDLRLDF